MALENIHLIDESLVPVKKGSNPLLSLTQEEMEAYINISEKALPGHRASFNQIEKQVTKEVIVTGLVLHFAQNLSESRLNSLLNRRDIQHIYLYADTIIISDRIAFPQANVTIGCRYLLIEEEGQISTTPVPPDHYTAPTDGKNTPKAGTHGARGGNITMLCNVMKSEKRSGNEFEMNGGNGQHGGGGGLNVVKRNTDVPLSWTKIEDAVISNDYWKGTKNNWHWPTLKGVPRDKVYFASIQAYNFSLGFENDRSYFSTTVGDKELANQKNGFDAFAAGNGGNGGNGGNFYLASYEKHGRSPKTEQKPGMQGISKKIEGGDILEDITYYHITFRAYHKNPNFAINKEQNKWKPFGRASRKLPPKKGKSAKGEDGRKGAPGKKIWLKNGEHWLGPLLLENMLGFAKTHFRDGERNKARWILDTYSREIRQIPKARQKEMHTASLIREVNLYSQRISQNLDFYGYPPGWIPRLSVISNLDILVASRRDFAQLIFFADRLLKQNENNKLNADNLEWAVNELNDGMKSARSNVIAAYDALPKIKSEIHQIEARVASQLIALRNLKDKILQEVEEQQRDQALFSGTFEILAGLCVLIPVGQPFVGQIGGGILGQISKIDIHSENPLVEGLSFAGGVSKELSSFITKNEKNLKETATSGINKQIDKGTKELSASSKNIEATAAQLKEAEAVLNGKLSGRELSLLHEKLRVLGMLSDSTTRKLSPSQDFVDIITNLDTLSNEVDAIKELSATQQVDLGKRLKELKTEKSKLSNDLKAIEKQRDQREKNIENTGKALAGFSDGASSIAKAIQGMMVEFDENDPAVLAKFEKIKKSKYKKDFEKIEEDILDLNRDKLPLVEQLLWFEQRISQGTQRINANLVQWSILNDQRVEAVQHGLLPSSKSALQRMIDESWAMLMLECFYLTKSYQYRFLRRINPIHHGMEAFITDIDTFSEGVDPGSMDKTAFEGLFDKVLKAQFQRLAKDLLIDTQGNTGRIFRDEAFPTIKMSDTNEQGESILQRLNERGRVQFRLEDIKSAKQGTENWKFYRIINMKFQDIKLGKVESAFDFGIRHSGISIVRDEQGRAYLFTSLSHQNDLNTPNIGADLNLLVQSWNGSYNGGNRSDASNGLSNSKHSNVNSKVLEKFLTNFDLWDQYKADDTPYTDHYPGATSLLTLMVYDESDNNNFEIEELKFKVEYEVMR